MITSNIKSNMCICSPLAAAWVVQGIVSQKDLHGATLPAKHSAIPSHKKLGKVPRNGTLITTGHLQLTGV